MINKKTKFIDLTGQKFGRLTVIKKTGNTKEGKTVWLCECECGNKINVRINISSRLLKFI